MKLSRCLSLSVEILAAHKLQTLLSVLGIVVGSGAVIVMTAIGDGARHEVVERIRSMGTNLVTVTAGQTRVIAGRERQMDVVTTLTTEDAEAIRRECESVADAAAAIDKKLSLRWENENAASTVVGMEARGLPIRNIEISAGRCFDDFEAKGARRVALLGPTAVRNLFPALVPPADSETPAADSDYSQVIGRVFRIGRIPFEAIGVTKPRGTDPNGLDQDDVVIIPLQTAMRRVMNVDYITSIYVRAKSSDYLASAESEIHRLLRRRHRLDDRRGKTAADDFTIQNQAILVETQNEAASSMTLLVASVSGISLAVGGVGILAVMLISVRERTPEIGLRRAVGATKRDIRVQFLLESGLIAVSGGMAGVACGIAGAWICRAVFDMSTLVTWPPIAGTLVLSATIGVAFGYYPAARAASLEPVTALRSE